MQRFFGVFAAFLMSLVVAFIGLFIASQYIDNTDDCTVTSKVAIQIRERRMTYRIHTSECGSFTFSAVPLRGIDSHHALGMWSTVNLGEQYKITYIREGFGVFSVNPAVVNIEPAN